MKLSKLPLKSARRKTGLLLLLVLGAFLVFYAGLAANYQEQLHQKQALEGDIVLLSRGVGRQTPSDEALQKGLKEAEERLARAVIFFPEQVRASEALDAILALTLSNSIQVVSIQEKTQVREVVGQRVYYPLPFTLKVKGSLEHLLALVTQMEQGQNGPVVLQRVELSRAGGSYTASLDFALYTRSRTETVPRAEETPPGGGSRGKG